MVGLVPLKEGGLMKFVKASLPSLILLPCLLSGCPSLGSTTWWDERPATIGQITGPTQALLGTAVVLTATSTMGSSGCTKFGHANTEISEATKEVRVSVTHLQARSNPPGGCVAIAVPHDATVSFLPEATGTYRMIALGFNPAQPTDEGFPAATMSVEILEP